MKKYLFMAIAAAAITSCTQDEVMEVAEKQAINFGDAFVENATRAIDGTYSTTNMPESFQVYGTTKGNETNASEVTIFNNVVDGLPTKISYDATNQEDLLYATATQENKNDKGEVEFTFDHLLAKAMFTVRNTMTTNTADYMYQYRVTDIQINNAALSADYTVGATTPWGAAKTNYTVDNPLEFGDVTENASTTDGKTALLIGAVGKADEATSHHQRVLIPATYTYNATTKTGGLNITCTIETLLNEEVVDLQNFNKSISYTFAPGNAYNFIISLGLNEPIKFTVTKVNDWVNQTPGTEIYQ